MNAMQEEQAHTPFEGHYSNVEFFFTFEVSLENDAQHTWLHGVCQRERDKKKLLKINLLSAVGEFDGASLQFAALLNTRLVTFNVCAVYRVCNPHSVTSCYQVSPTSIRTWLGVRVLFPQSHTAHWEQTTLYFLWLRSPAWWARQLNLSSPFMSWMSRWFTGDSCWRFANNYMVWRLLLFFPLRIKAFCVCVNPGWRTPSCPAALRPPSRWAGGRSLTQSPWPYE